MNKRNWKTEVDNYTITVKNLEILIYYLKLSAAEEMNLWHTKSFTSFYRIMIQDFEQELKNQQLYLTRAEACMKGN